MLKKFDKVKDYIRWLVFASEDVLIGQNADSLMKFEFELAPTPKGSWHKTLQ
jgi:hypothetical protein